MARTSKYQILEAQPPLSRLWKVALYVRLSREDLGGGLSESIQSQKLLLNDFAARYLDMQVVDTYVDDGYSGTSFERDGFKRMFEDICSGRINCIIVKDLSRLGRNYVETGKYLEVIFPTLKTRFISVNDNVDSFLDPSSVNNVIIPFKNIINDEYCRDISLKVRSSLTIKRKQGQFIGSFAAYGYQKDPQNRNKLIIDEDAAEIVRIIFSLFLGGKSILGIAKHLNSLNIKSIADYKKSKGLNYRPSGKNTTSGLWSDFSVRRILTNRVYTGDLEQKKTETVSYKVRVSRQTPKEDRIIVRNTHQPIVTKEVFDRVQSLLKRDTRSTKKGELGLFSGFVKCADCLRPMQKKTITQPYKTYDYYICSTFKRIAGQCTKHTLRLDVLENTVLTVVKKYIVMAVNMDELIEEISKSPHKNTAASRLKSAIINNENQKEKANRILLDLYPDYKSGLINKEQYLALKDKYDKQIQSLNEIIIKLKQDLNKQGEGGENDFIAVFKKYKNITKLSRQVLEGLINNIFVHEGGGIQIDFKFKDAFLDAIEFVNKNKNNLSMDFAAQNLAKI